MISLDVTERIERVITNARRFATPAIAVALALDLVAPIAGRSWSPVCSWCLDRDAPQLAEGLVHRLAMASSTDVGGCARCAYSGCDTLVAALEIR